MFENILKIIGTITVLLVLLGKVSMTLNGHCYEWRGIIELIKSLWG